MQDSYSPLDEAKFVLEQRRIAYARVFSGGASKADLEIVLDDLSKFCRAHTPAFDPDPRIHALLEGRREVWLRIAEHCSLDHEALFRRYHGRKT